MVCPLLTRETKSTIWSSSLTERNNLKENAGCLCKSSYTNSFHFVAKRSDDIAHTGPVALLVLKHETCLSSSRSPTGPHVLYIHPGQFCVSWSHVSPVSYLSTFSSIYVIVSVPSIPLAEEHEQKSCKLNIDKYRRQGRYCITFFTSFYLPSCTCVF